MIARLKGEIWELSATKVVVGCAGVGYELHVPETVSACLGNVGTQADLYVRQVIREDDHSLFGFANVDQRRLFDLLRDVRGCGARISLAVIGTLGVVVASEAIAAEDAKTLIRVTGVGPRLAERIVVELKAKMQEFQLYAKFATGSRPPRAPEPVDDLVDALIGLGYPRARVEPVAEEARRESDDLAEQVRLALQRMAR